MGWLASFPSLTYEKCKEVTARKSPKKIAHNTWLRKEEENFVVKFHDTDIIKFFPSGNYQINIEGWHTATTRDRLTNVLNRRAYIKQGILYYNDVPLSGPVNFHADGTPIDGQAATSGVNKVLTLKKKIKDYAKGFIQKLEEGKIPAPGPGDCWYCSMKVKEPKADEGKTLGDVGDKDGDHLLSHIKEKYYVPSLLWNSVTAEDAPTSQICKAIIYEIFQGRDAKAACFGFDIAMTQARKALIKYLERRLINGNI